MKFEKAHKLKKGYEIGIKITKFGKKISNLAKGSELKVHEIWETIQEFIKTVHEIWKTKVNEFQ